jgi:hypothetical protein
MRNIFSQGARACCALALLPGCSLYVNDVLAAAEADVVGDEGEGEGEGNEGEGEGEGGEGEGENTDPACEADERLIVLRDEEVDAVQVYALDNGGFVRRRPAGTNANVNLDNDDQNAQNNGYGATGVALGGDDKLFVVGSRFLYQLDRGTLDQEPIAGRTQLTLEAFGSASHVEVIGDTVLTFGINVRSFPVNANAGAASVEFHTGDDYLGSTRFRIGTTDFVAASAEYGYVVIGAEDGEAPTVRAFLDTEFDTDRIHSFGSGLPRKGIAFDPATRKLLLGDFGRVIVMSADNNFLFPEDDDGDFVLLDGGTSDVTAIAARGGFAWVLLRRGTDNLIKLDLSQSPPRSVAIGTVDTSSFGRDLAVGCRRVFASGSDNVVAADRDTLRPAGQIPVRPSGMRLVKREDLGLEGDD